MTDGRCKHGSIEEHLRYIENWTPSQRIAIALYGRKFGANVSTYVTDLIITGLVEKIDDYTYRINTTDAAIKAEAAELYNRADMPHVNLGYTMTADCCHEIYRLILVPFMEWSSKNASRIATVDWHNVYIETCASPEKAVQFLVKRCKVDDDSVICFAIRSGTCDPKTIFPEIHSMKPAEFRKAHPELKCCTNDYK
jgi:hypothetical protein